MGGADAPAAEARSAQSSNAIEGNQGLGGGDGGTPEFRSPTARAGSPTTACRPIGYRPAPAFASIEQYLGRHTQECYRALATASGPRWDPSRDALSWDRSCVQAHYVQARSVARDVEESARLWLLIEDRRSTPGSTSAWTPSLRRGARIAGGERGLPQRRSRSEREPRLPRPGRRGGRRPAGGGGPEQSDPVPRGARPRRRLAGDPRGPHPSSMSEICSPGDGATQ